MIFDLFLDKGQDGKKGEKRIRKPSKKDKNPKSERSHKKKQNTSKDQYEEDNLDNQSTGVGSEAVDTPHRRKNVNTSRYEADISRVNE
jgi:hypothetical protein